MQPACRPKRPILPGPAPSPPPSPAAASRPTLTLPGRASSAAGPRRACPRAAAGRFGPLPSGGNSRRDVNTASAATGPTPRRVRALPARARLPLCESRSNGCPGRSPPPPQPPAGVTASASGKPRRSPGANNTGAGRGRGGGGGGTRDGRASLRAPSQPRRPARALTCSASPGRPRRPFPSSRAADEPPLQPPLAGRPEGAGASLAARAAPRGEEETKQRRATPRSAARPPTPNRRGDGGDTEPGAGSTGGGPRPARPPPSAPSSAPPPSASRRRRRQDTRAPRPPAPPSARRGGGRRRPQRLSNAGRLSGTRGPLRARLGRARIPPSRDA